MPGLPRFTRIRRHKPSGVARLAAMAGVSVLLFQPRKRQHVTTAESTLRLLEAGGLHRLFATGELPMIAHKSAFAGLLVAMTLLSACTDEAPPTLPPQITVDIVPDTATLTMDSPGNTRQFTAVLTNAANQAVIWRSSVPGIATVSGTGLVTAVAT